MADFGLTDSGFLAPRATDLADQIREEYEAETGLPVDWDVDVFLGVITAVVADRTGDLSEMLQAIADSRDPDNATGAQLDSIANVVGVERRPATFSIVDLTLDGDAGTVVPEGAEVEHPNGTIWITQDAAQLDGTGSAEIAARPQDTGPISAPATAGWEISTPVDGWDGATSTTDATVGQARETNSELRQRRQESLQITGAASLNAIRSNVLEVDGVQAAIVADNDTLEEKTVSGIVLPGKSFAVVVYPALTADQSEALALEIYRRSPAGIELIGDESATVTGFDGHDKTIKWSIADEINVAVEVTVTGSDASDVEDEITDLIGGYFDVLNVGDAVRILQILGLVADVPGVDSASVSLNGSPSDVEPTITEIAALDTVTVIN